MSLKEKLQSDLTSAMRGRDDVRSSTIRMILTSIRNEEVSGKEVKSLSDAEVFIVLSREAKKRREAAEAFDSAGAKDRADAERSEGLVIAEYLPQQLTESEIRGLISQAMSETGAATPAQMGLVMKALQPKIAGRADGAMVSRLVKQALAEGK